MLGWDYESLLGFLKGLERTAGTTMIADAL